MELVNKVYAEYCNSAKLAERRYQFLLKMPKALRPYNHQEVIAQWKLAREKYFSTIKD